MVKSATAISLTLTQTEHGSPNPYQQGTMPGFELVALPPTSLPVLDEVSNQGVAHRDHHAILTLPASTSAETDNSTLPTSDPTRPSQAPKAKARVRATPGSWPAGVPVAQGYAVYAFYKHQPEKNVLREYRLEYAPSLWSAHVVARSWGRRGGKERLAQVEFSDQAEALNYLRRQVAKRVGRGYVLAR